MLWRLNCLIAGMITVAAVTTSDAKVLRNKHNSQTVWIFKDADALRRFDKLRSSAVYDGGPPPPPPPPGAPPPPPRPPRPPPPRPPRPPRTPRARAAPRRPPPRRAPRPGAGRPRGPRCAAARRRAAPRPPPPRPAPGGRPPGPPPGPAPAAPAAPPRARGNRIARRSPAYPTPLRFCRIRLPSVELHAGVERHYETGLEFVGSGSTELGHCRPHR